MSLPSHAQPGWPCCGEGAGGKDSGQGVGFAGLFLPSSLQADVSKMIFETC